MKLNKIKLLIPLTFLFFSLTGCGEDTVVNVNVENGVELNNITLGNFISISDNLYYDSATRIVYISHGMNSLYESKTYCPYYAPNGLPYRYNPETNTFEEIKENE